MSRMQKDLIPDEHDGEKVKEELDGGARSAQDRQQVYNKAWLRRTREAAHKHGAIVRHWVATGPPGRRGRTFAG